VGGSVIGLTSEQCRDVMREIKVALQERVHLHQDSPLYFSNSVYCNFERIKHDGEGSDGWCCCRLTLAVVLLSHELVDPNGRPLRMPDR
jgi:hypothetical protein